MKTGVIGFVALAVTASVGCTQRATESTAASVRVPVSVVQATNTDVASTFEAGGVVRARATAFIASRVLAPIRQILVRPGDRVRSGAPLVILDTRDIEANKGSAAATSLSAAEAARAADADVRAAESALVLARATHDRMASLHAKRSATTQELDQAVAALAAAEAQRTGAQARLSAAIAARDAAAAAAESAAISATYGVLSSPFDSVVTERRADPGSMAAPGAILLVLEDPAAYRLEAEIDEARAALAQTGQRVLVRVDSASIAGDGWTAGRVAEVARVDPTSHSFVVKIDLPTSPSLRSGLFGRVRLFGPTRQALTVPQSALVNRGQLTFVYLVDGEDARARLRPVSIGVPYDDRVEVLAGIRQGDVVVTNPPASLADGAQVTRQP